MSDPETSLPMLPSSPSSPESPPSPNLPPAAVVFRKNGSPRKASSAKAGTLVPSICSHIRHASPLILFLIFLFFILVTALIFSLLYLSLSSSRQFSHSSADVCQSEACVTAGNWLHGNINFTVDPCTNFYLFACGNWIAKNAIPDDKSTINTFILVQDNVTESMRQLLEQRRQRSNSSSQNDNTLLKTEQKNATVPKVVKLALEFYDECRDQDSRDQLGVGPLKDLLQKLLGTSWPILTTESDESGNNSSKAHNVSFIETYLGFREHGINTIISFGVSTNLSDTERNIVSFYSPSFSMGRKQYANESEYSEEVAAFRRYMHDVAVLFAPDNVNETLLELRLEEIYQLEKRLVLFSRPIEESRYASLMNNQMSLGELKALTGNRLDWTALLQQHTRPFNLSYTVNDDFRVNVEELPYYVNMTDLVMATPYPVLANYMAYRMISSFSGYADRRLQAIDFEYSRTTSGVKRPVSQWEGCFNTLKMYFDEALTRLYVDHFVDQGTKRVADEMIDDLKAAFEYIVQREAPWLDEETRQRALEKAAATLFNVAYPDWILNDAELDAHFGLYENSTETSVESMVKGGHFFESLLAIKQLNRGKWFRELKQLRNRTKHWVLSPTEVNASAGLRSNTIVLPVALLQKPFFDPDRPFYLNYGSIGEVIGHEITHHVDDEGSQHDQFGDLNNWWTEHTKNRFSEASTCFIEQYGSIVDYKTGKKVNPINTLGENIADNGAVREAFYAFQSKSKRSKLQLVPKMEAFTFEQLFFISLGQNYCSNDRIEELKRKLDVDPHTPDEYRANIALANFDHFAKAFNCPAGSPMNPDESNRCRLW